MLPTAQQVVTADRRRGDRRRMYRTLFDWRWARGGRRQQARRDADTQVLLDWYHPELLLAGVLILLLSAADLIFTGTLIDGGLATEANPIARMFMDHGFAFYVNVKMAVAGVAVVWMVMFSRLQVFGGLSMRTVMYSLLGVYLTLACYQVGLLLTRVH